MLHNEPTQPMMMSLDEELRFLRGLVSVYRLADEVLEDCLEQRLGLQAAVDAYLTQCARMIHARAGFVQLLGTTGPVLTRVWGSEYVDVSAWANADLPIPLEGSRTVFVAPLNIGKIHLGSLGFVLPGHFADGGVQIRALVTAVAEALDSTVLSFVALADGHTPLERLSEQAAETDFEPSARIGKYELLHPLGSGGMAQVMVARTLNPGGVSRLVALKRILSKLASEKQAVNQFLDEARLGMKLNHQNLVTIFDFGQAQGSYYIAMELVKGADLDRVIYLPGGSLPPAFITGVLVQALEGLQSAHDLRGDDGLPLGLVHRDLSPHNIMVGFDGRVKVLDFGVAKMREQRTITMPGIAKGKPLYMSPEQAVAESIDRRSDIFSMGLILYEAFMCRRAFATGDDSTSMEAIVNNALPKPDNFPPAFWRIVDKAIQKNREDRFQTAREMADAIRSVLRPMPESEIGMFMSARFPKKVNEFAKLEQMKAERAKASSAE